MGQKKKNGQNTLLGYDNWNAGCDVLGGKKDTLLQRGIVSPGTTGVLRRSITQVKVKILTLYGCYKDILKSHQRKRKQRNNDLGSK